MDEVLDATTETLGSGRLSCGSSQGRVNERVGEFKIRNFDGMVRICFGVG